MSFFEKVAQNQPGYDIISVKNGELCYSYIKSQVVVQMKNKEKHRGMDSAEHIMVCLSAQNGFKLGARMMLEVMEE